MRPASKQTPFKQCHQGKQFWGVCQLLAAWSKVEFYFSLPDSGAQGTAYGPALRGSSGCRPFYWLHFVSDPADTQVLLLNLVFFNKVEIMHLLGKNILFVLNSLTLVKAKDSNVGWCSVCWLLYKLSKITGWVQSMFWLQKKTLVWLAFIST